MGDDHLDLKTLFNKVRGYWYFYAIMLAVSLGGAYYYLQTASPRYKAQATLLIKNEEATGQLDEETMFADLGMGEIAKNLENETQVLTSTPLMTEVVENLALEYVYSKQGQFRSEDLYPHSPIEVMEWHPVIEKVKVDGTIDADQKGGYKLTIEEEEYYGEFGKPLELPKGKLILTRNNQAKLDGPIDLSIYPVQAMAKTLSRQLLVEVMGEESSTLVLSIENVSRQRAEDILAELIKVYNQNNIADKKKVFENALSIIDERIELLAGELAARESAVEAYKRRFNMVELSAEGGLLMTELANYNKQIANKEVQVEILESVEKQLVENQNSFEFVPTNIDMTNLTLTNQLESFNKLLADREKLQSELGPAHPDFLLVGKQIQNLRQTIINNIRSIKADLQITTDADRKLRNNLEGRLQSLPTRERELVDIERRKDIKENLYLYLLQKREEAAISMAVTVPNSKTVEPPISSSDPVSPKTAQIWLIALFLGLALPSGLVLLLESMKDKVLSEEEIERSAKVTVVGKLALNPGKGNLVVGENNYTAGAEMFRLLRANLAYATPGKHLQVVLVTSSVPGEGKSFISLNLGVTQALAGKKVVLLELDLRKPKKEGFAKGKPLFKGIADYLVDPSITAEQVIRKNVWHQNFDVIGCGTKPPNPSELLLSPRLPELIGELRGLYDFIIIDVPPVGLVADALQLKDLVDATMFVVRASYTRKAHLQILRDIVDKQKLPKPFVVLNGVPESQAVGYGYGKGYYQDSSKQPKLPSKQLKKVLNGKKEGKKLAK